jgi:hypothetical protein
MDAFKECEKIMQKDHRIAAHIGKYVGTILCTKLLYPSDYLFHILKQVLWEALFKGIDFNEPLFNNKFSDLEFFLYHYRDTLQYFAIHLTKERI